MGIAIEVLKLANDNSAATALQHYFDTFRCAYIAGKPHLSFAL
ncbi:hypothetical protein [Rheinheimera pacifica]|nr:hypothetical protein [Rheinheimera pacifica]